MRERLWAGVAAGAAGRGKLWAVVALTVGRYQLLPACIVSLILPDQSGLALHSMRGRRDRQAGEAVQAMMDLHTFRQWVEVGRHTRPNNHLQLFFSDLLLIWIGSKPTNDGEKQDQDNNHV